MEVSMKAGLTLYTRYPLSSVVLYNGITLLHFLLGGAGLILGYASWPGYLAGSIYLVFAFTQMYALMPLKVCPNCPYYKLNNSLCISGLNVISKRFAREGTLKDFPNRAKGALCPNNLYLAGFITPIIALVPALILSFSYLVLGILLAVAALLTFRFFVLFTKVACGHCRAKSICPNAQAMGLSGN